MLKLKTMGMAATVLLTAVTGCVSPEKKETTVMNDSNTPLHLLQPDYKVPYGVPTVESVKEVMDRVLHYLQACTPTRGVDAKSGQEITDYAFTTTYTTGSYGGSSSYTKGNAANENLKWETTASYNVGVDLGLLHNRVNIVADVYYKKTSDLLLVVPMGFASGVTEQLQNVGNVVTRVLNSRSTVLSSTTEEYSGQCRPTWLTTATGLPTWDSATT